MRYRPSIVLLVLGLFLVQVALPVAAQDATPSASPATPSQPLPPTTGPGSDDTPYPAARATRYGTAPGGFWLWEPTSGDDVSTPIALDEAAGTSLPIIIFFSGCCADMPWVSPTEVDAWLTHLARQGAVVIAPIFRHGTPLGDSYPRIKDALAELARPGHAPIDRTRVGVVGFSYGGMAAVIYAANAEAEGLPVPRALFLSAPCMGNGFCLVAPKTAQSFPAGMKALVLSFKNDEVVNGYQTQTVYDALRSLPAADRDYVTMWSDRHGQPPIVAGHPTTYDGVDTADRYGVWKLSDALLACAFTGTGCDYALGNSPEQRFMGVWSDGVPVHELEVTD